MQTHKVTLYNSEDIEGVYDVYFDIDGDVINIIGLEDEEGDDYSHDPYLNACANEAVLRLLREAYENRLEDRAARVYDDIQSRAYMPSTYDLKERWK